MTDEIEALQPDVRKNGENSAERNVDGTFKPGNGGRPRGARNKTTQAVEALLQGQAEALTQTAIDAALGGDVIALKLCLERIAPPRKDAPVNFQAPKIETTHDAAAAIAGVVAAVSSGELTPGEGAVIAGLIECCRRTLETEVLEHRIDFLEQEMKR